MMGAVNHHLADLDPAEVGEAAARAVTERIAALSLPLSPGVTVALGRTEPEDLRATDLAATFETLTRYAQGGVPVGDWVDDEDAADAILGATEALLAAPGRPWNPEDLDAPGGALGLRRDETPEAPMLVLACAWTRVRIARGDTVPLASLARLASLSYQRAHQLAARGDFRVVRDAPDPGGQKPALVKGEAARRWLASRGLWPEKVGK